MTDLRSETEAETDAVTGDDDGDGPDAPPGAPAPDVDPAAGDPATEAEPVTGTATATAPGVRHLLAGLSAAAGAVHLAMVPAHMGEWAAEGVAFLLTGWFQLAFAAVVLLLTRPGRVVLAVGAAANALFVAAWAVTRTAGPPFGPEAGEAEPATLVDLTVVGLEAALVLLAVAVLARPGLAAGLAHRRFLGAVPGLVAVGVVALASVAVASPSARDHGHGGAAGDDHAAGDHAGDAMAGDHHDADRGMGADAADAAALRPGDDRGLAALSNGHHHEMVVHELDAVTQAELDEQLAVTREVAALYPTVADAEAAGYRRIGPYFPGIGAHYGKTTPAELNPDGVMDREALLHPLAIIYDGTKPHSRVAGFMYLSTSDTEPEGFAGPNDVWHYHESLCLDYLPNGEINVPFGLDNQSTPEQCAAAGARMIPISPWMVHVWSAPGWDDDPDVPTFGEVHTDLTCADGTYHMRPIEEWVDHQDHVCLAPW
ncbi:MAG TPA: hypothetical protein VIL36_23105 [Acidimicrobiales bacterium]